MSDLVERAAAIAIEAHAGQKRKFPDIPYATHTIAVAITLAQHGFPEPVIAAALVHDVLEDTAFGEEKLRAELGEEVVEIVKIVSEDKTLAWEERKRKYIESVKQGSPEAKAVSAADKIHNLKSFLEGYTRVGESIWAQFNATKEKRVWFEGEMLKALQESWQHPLIKEYEALVQKLKSLV